METKCYLSKLVIMSLHSDSASNEEFLGLTFIRAIKKEKFYSLMSLQHPIFYCFTA